MNLDILEKIIEKNLENKTAEVKRVFHGRGNFYDDFTYLVVDSIDDVLFFSLFEKNENEEKIVELLEKVFKKYKYKYLVCQKRYEKNAQCEFLFGENDKEFFALENSLKYKINFENKNIGLFFDMKNGREYLKNISKDKNILNLFSYTCAFSVSAISAGAKQVVNVDMAKNALNIGKQNHKLNELDLRKVKFLPFNILKSWSKIKKFAPYDIIVIDPPSFQKGSFAASKDYEKIIKRLDTLVDKNATILSCLNAPELDTSFIKELFKECAKDFKYKNRLENVAEFVSNNEEKSLKNLIFEK